MQCHTMYTEEELTKRQPDPFEKNEEKDFNLAFTVKKHYNSTDLKDPKNVRPPEILR